MITENANEKFSFIKIMQLVNPNYPIKIGVKQTKNSQEKLL